VLNTGSAGKDGAYCERSPKSNDRLG